MLVVTPVGLYVVFNMAAGKVRQSLEDQNKAVCVSVKGVHGVLMPLGAKTFVDILREI